MSENKFLAKMRGEKAPKSLVEVKNDKFSTPFVGLPKSTSVTDGFDNEAEHSIVVAKSAQNWALQKSGIELLADAKSADYTGQVSIAGHGMWVNSSYTFPLSEEPANPVVAIINPCAKWVLNFVGKDLFSQNDTIGFTLVVKVGATHISNIDCEVKRQAGFFCKKFVIDFSESEQELIKVNGGDTLTVQLVCNDDTASAVYYTGSSVLSLLQRKVDGDVVAGNTKTFGDLVEDVYDIREEIKNKFLGVYRFKGTVPTYTALPQQNNVIGDTYNVNDTGSNYTWDGTAWDKLSETVDLSPYLTKAEAEATYLPKATVLDYDNITNCITEIPQTVKYTFENGVLTILAGTVAYLPNGAGVFNKLTTTRDITISFASINAANEDIMIFVGFNADGTIARTIRKVSSGTTNPGLTYSAWYDTTNNIINDYGSDATTPIRQASLPILTLKTGADTITEITQVFNGFGYIGSTIFALPGVRGLIPNGRNEDGTLKNTAINGQIVKTTTRTSAYSATLVAYNNGTLGAWSTIQYDPVKNITYNNSTPKANVAMIGKCAFGEGGRVTLFEPNQPFHAVDYNDFENTVEEINSSISAVDSSAVHKTGTETIGGRKAFSENTSWIYDGVDTSVLPSSSAYMAWNSVYSKNGARLSYVETSYLTDGMIRTQYGTEKYIDGTKYSAYLRMEVKADKTTAITLSSNPAASSNSTHVATTAWVRDLFETLYPVGSLYITSTNTTTCPLASIVKKSDGSNSTWALVSSGKALWTGTGSNGNTTIAAGLPNITGTITTDQNMIPSASGAFSITTGTTYTHSNGQATGCEKISFDASQSNSIYGQSTTVQPPAYVVNVWRRTA